MIAIAGAQARSIEIVKSCHSTIFLCPLSYSLRTSLSVSLSVPGDELGTHPPQPYFRSTVSTLIISLFHRPSFSLAYGDPGAARTRIILGQ